MARSTRKPLSTRDAKAQLREASAHSGVSHWVRTHPYEALGLGVVTGMALGARRPPPLALLLVARRLIQTLL